MPLTLKKGFDGTPYIERAGRRRVADQENRILSESQVDELLAQFLKNSKITYQPQLMPGSTVSSNLLRTFFKDVKFNVGVISEQGVGLEKEIRENAKSNFALLDDIQREALALDSTVTEDETKRSSRFSTVHYNSFVRARDMGVDFDDPNWLSDYKTGLTFLAGNMSSVMPATGLTLPLFLEENIPVLDVILVGEDTDVGDSESPIISSAPINVICPNKTFRHVIIRKEHNDTSRLFNHTPSYCTLLLEFASTQLINTITVRPLGHSPVYVDSLVYVNEGGEEVSLGSSSYSSETMTTLLFEPVRTKYLKVQFRQYAPVAKLSHDTSDLRIRELNKILEGAGWQQTLPETGEVIQGRVFDFSIESISVSLRTYTSLGIFRARPLAVKGPSGITLSKKAEAITIDSANRVYGSSASLGSGVVLSECYVGTKLYDEAGSIVLNALIPVPDSFPVQREFLPIIGPESRLKLFPDMLWSANKNTIVSAVLSGTGMLLTTNTNHNIEVGDYITKLTVVPALSQTDFQVVSEDWTVVDGNTVMLNDITGSATLIDLSPTPFFFVDDDDSNPLNIYQNGVVLTIGTDYEISLDSGGTWLAEFPQGVDWIPFRDAAAAGRCRILFLNPNYSDFYWIEYRPLKNQKLIPSGQVELRGGRVVFSRDLSTTQGTMQTVIISRADSTNVYLTPVILSYFLKVRENAT